MNFIKRNRDSHKDDSTEYINSIMRDNDKSANVLFIKEKIKSYLDSSLRSKTPAAKTRRQLPVSE